MKVSASYLALICLYLGLLFPLIFWDLGIGQDVSAVILAALRQLMFSPFDLVLFDNLLFNLFNYSHGWMSLVILDFIYLFAGVLGIPLYTWVLTFPSTLCVFLTALLIFWIVKDISKNYAASFFAAALFVGIPIVIGFSRAGILVNALGVLSKIAVYFVLAHYMAGGQTAGRYRKLGLVFLGLLICSDNAFPMFWVLSIGYLILGHWLKAPVTLSYTRRFLQALIDTCRFFWSFWTLVPALILLGYIAVYIIEDYYPYGIGFFRYTLKRDPHMDLGIPPNFFPTYFDHLGVVMGFLLPLCVVGIIMLICAGKFNAYRADLFFLLIWFAQGGLMLFLYEPRQNAFVYIPLLLPSVCIFAGLGMSLLLRKWSLIPHIAMFMLLGGNLLFSYSYVFDFPFQGPPRLYGKPQNYLHTHEYKAAGTILRSEGDAFARHRGTVLAGLCIGETSHIANFYMGSYTLPDPAHVTYNYNPDSPKPTQLGPETQVVVIASLTNHCKEKKQEILEFVQEKQYVLKHIILDQGHPVVQIYYKNGDRNVEPIFHDKDHLMAEWDRQFAHVSNLIGRSGAM